MLINLIAFSNFYSWIITGINVDNSGGPLNIVEY